MRWSLLGALFISSSVFFAPRTGYVSPFTGAAS